MPNRLQILFVLVAITLCTRVAHAQEQTFKLFEADDGFLTFQQVAEAEGTASDLFARSRLWIAENYNSSEAATDFVDEENTVIVVKGVIPITNLGFPAMVHHVMRIEARDGRARMTVNQLVYQGDTDAPRIPFENSGLRKMPRKQRTIEKTEEILTSLFMELKDYLNGNGAGGDDW